MCKTGKNIAGQNSVNKIKSIPELVSGSSTHHLNHYGWETPSVEDAETSSAIKLYRTTAHGFTLIELLVVVLIIGILAAVALPQYQKAVVKSQISEMMIWIDSMVKAEKIFYLSNGTYTTNYADLDIATPLETTNTAPCNFGDPDARMKKGNITVAIATKPLAKTPFVAAVFNKGRYKCGGLIYLLQHYSKTDLPEGLYCQQYEGKDGTVAAASNQFCAQFFGPITNGKSLGSWTLFKI